MAYSRYSEIFIICGYYDMGIRTCKLRGINHRAKNVHIVTPDNFNSKLRGRKQEESDKWLILHSAYEDQDMSAVLDALKVMKAHVGQGAHNGNVD
jgi:hypothetical protein